jgi:hypothetical protein
VTFRVARIITQHLIKRNRFPCSTPSRAPRDWRSLPVIGTVITRDRHA